jgi:hypothetical protein
MSKLILSTTMTVDGVITVGEWYVSEGEHDRASRDQFVDGAAMLMGRKTYEGLAGYWSSETGEWADQLNPMPKFVASRTLEGPLEWNSTLIEGDATGGSRGPRPSSTETYYSSAAATSRVTCSSTASSTSSGSGYIPLCGDLASVLSRGTSRSGSSSSTRGRSTPASRSFATSRRQPGSTSAPWKSL